MNDKKLFLVAITLIVLPLTPNVPDAVILLAANVVIVVAPVTLKLVPTVAVPLVTKVEKFAAPVTPNVPDAVILLAANVVTVVAPVTPKEPDAVILLAANVVNVVAPVTPNVPDAVILLADNDAIVVAPFTLNVLFNVTAPLAENVSNVVLPPPIIADCGIEFTGYFA